MTKAQQDFIDRKDSSDNLSRDGREFLSWYHSEDMHRIAYLIYQRQTKSTQDLIHPPMIVLSSETHSFEEKMAFCLHVLKNSEKKILPFIIAPEIGAAHWMSGFIRLNGRKEQPTLFLFNPTGYVQTSAKKRLSIEDMDNVASLKMLLSPARIQRTELDEVPEKGSTALVSCGPIAMMFLEHLLTNPQYAFDLDNQFVLPKHFLQLGTQNRAEYQKSICLQRQAHYELLETLADEDLDRIDNAHYQLVEQFLQGKWKSGKTAEKEKQPAVDKPNHKDIKKVDNPPNLQAELNKFEGLLNQLKVKTNELITKGDEENPNHSQYKHAKRAAEKLIRALETAQGQFFRNEQNINTYHIFQKGCADAILEAKSEFQNHRGWWHTLYPILKGLLGLFATVTVIPALVVANKSKHGYWGTFFSTPKTDSLEKLETFEQNLESYFTRDLAAKF